MSLVFDSCIDGSQFFTDIISRVNFNDVRQNCQANGGELALTTNTEIFTRAQTFLNDLISGTEPVWIGAQDLVGDGTLGPIRFQFLDGSDNNFLNVEVGNFPWFDGQPNDSGHSEDCISTRNLNDHILEDTDCSEERQSFCSRICQTQTLTFNDVDDEENGFLQIGLGIAGDAILLLTSFLLCCLCCLMTMKKKKIKKKKK